MTMNEKSMSRSWTTAAMAAGAGAVMLALDSFWRSVRTRSRGIRPRGGFGDGKVKVVRVISGDDAENLAVMAASEDSAAQRGVISASRSVKRPRATRAARTSRTSSRARRPTRPG
jgi:hypothetical protein